jgi:hypothetical protein
MASLMSRRTEHLVLRRPNWFLSVGRQDKLVSMVLSVALLNMKRRNIETLEVCLTDGGAGLRVELYSESILNGVGQLFVFQHLTMTSRFNCLFLIMQVVSKAVSA